MNRIAITVDAGYSERQYSSPSCYRSGERSERLSSSRRGPTASSFSSFGRCAVPGPSVNDIRGEDGGALEATLSPEVSAQRVRGDIRVGCTMIGRMPGS